MYGSLAQVISHRSLRSISASMAMSPSGRPAIGTRETLAWALTVPLGLNWSTTLRTSGLSAMSSVSSIGTDSAVMSSLTTASGPGFVDGPLHVQRAAADAEGLHVDRQRVLLQGERAPQVVERIGEMAVVGRDVVAGDLGAQLDRPAGHGAGEVDLGADEPAGLEDVPELDVLGRRPGRGAAAGRAPGRSARRAGPAARGAGRPAASSRGRAGWSRRCSPRRDGS